MLQFQRLRTREQAEHALWRLSDSTAAVSLHEVIRDSVSQGITSPDTCTSFPTGRPVSNRSEFPSRRRPGSARYSTLPQSNLYRCTPLHSAPGAARVHRDIKSRALSCSDTSLCNGAFSAVGSFIGRLVNFGGAGSPGPRIDHCHNSVRYIKLHILHCQL